MIEDRERCVHVLIFVQVKLLKYIRIVDQSDRKLKTSFATINLGLDFDVLINDELILSFKNCKHVIPEGSIELYLYRVN